MRFLLSAWKRRRREQRDAAATATKEKQSNNAKDAWKGNKDKNLHTDTLTLLLRMNGGVLTSIHLP